MGKERRTVKDWLFFVAGMAMLFVSIVWLDIQFRPTVVSVRESVARLGWQGSLDYYSAVLRAKINGMGYGGLLFWQVAITWFLVNWSTRVTVDHHHKELCMLLERISNKEQELAGEINRLRDERSEIKEVLGDLARSVDGGFEGFRKAMEKLVEWAIPPR